jgi:hypothetical protein
MDTSDLTEGKYVLLNFSETEKLLDLESRSHEVSLASPDSYVINKYDCTNAWDDCKSQAGIDLDRESVHLASIHYSDDLKITEWAIRLEKYEPVLPLPSALDELYKKSPGNQCYVFDSLNPRFINLETKEIDIFAHVACQKIYTLLQDWADFLEEAFYNPSYYSKLKPNLDISKGPAKKVEPGLIDKLIELWKLQGFIKSAKSQIESEGKTKSMQSNVAWLTMKQNWRSSVYDSLLQETAKKINDEVDRLLSVQLYKHLVCSYNMLKILIDRQYCTIINQVLYHRFIKQFLHGQYSQMTIILCVRALANVLNRTIWKHFLIRKQEFFDKKTQKENAKIAKQEQIFAQASKATAIQIDERVDSRLEKHGITKKKKR